MQPSMFNVQVPVPARDEVFLMNTSRAQSGVGRCRPRASRAGDRPRPMEQAEREALETLAENGLSPDRAGERENSNQFSATSRRQLQSGYVSRPQ